MRLVALILLLLWPLHVLADPVTLATIGGFALANAGFVYIGYALVIGASIYGSHQAKKDAERQREQQRRAHNDSLQDRTVTRIATNAPFRYILGEARVGSDIVAMFTSGDRDQYRWLVCVHAAHECDSVLEYYIGGKPLGALDGNGWVTSASPDYYSEKPVSTSETFTGTSKVLAHTPVASTVRLTYFKSSGGGADSGKNIVVAHTLSGSTVTATGGQQRDYTVWYDWVEPSPRVRVLSHLGGASDPVDSVLNAAFPVLWPATAVLRGFCYSVVMLDLNQPEFQGGIPPIEPVIRGMKLHDPRDAAYPADTPVWSQNPALVALWYLLSDLCEVDAADIPLDDYITAANVCAPITGCTYSQSGYTVTVSKTAHGRVFGEVVDMQMLTGTTVDGYYIVASVPNANQFTYSALVWDGTQYVADSRTTSGNCTIGGKYTANGTITSDEEPPQVLKRLADSMAGGIVDTTWGCWAGAYTAPVMALTQDDIVGSFSTVGGSEWSKLANGVRGQYCSPMNEYVVTDFTPYQNAAYLAADGTEKWLDMNFPMTDNVHRVHQLCRTLVEDQRNGFTLRVQFSLKAWSIRLGERITFTGAFIGQSAKVYRLMRREFSPASGLMLEFKEDTSATYDPADAATPETTPNTSLANPWAVAAPAGLAFKQPIPNPERAEITWTAVSNVYAMNYQVEYMGSRDATWKVMSPVSSPSNAIDGLAPDTYLFRVKAINPILNVHSAYSSTLTGEMAVMLVPNVSGLEIYGQGNSTVFGGKHCRLAWRKSSVANFYDIGSEPWGANSGGLDYFFKDYRVSIYTTGGTLLRTEYVTDENYIYTHEHNAEDNGGTAAREFTVKVWQRGKYGQLSVYPATLPVSNPAPDLPGVTVLEGIDTVTIAYARPTDLDWTGIKIWMSTTDGFTPSAANLVYDGIDTAATINGIVPNTTYYYKYAVRDEFGDSATSAQGSFATSLSNQSQVNTDALAALNLRPYGADGNNGSGSPGGCGVLLSSILFELPKNPQALKISAVANSIRARLSGSSAVILTYRVQAIAINSLRQLTGTISINAAGTITGVGTAFLTEMGGSLLLGSSSGTGSFVDENSGMFPLTLNAPSTDTAGSLKTTAGYYTDGAFSCSGVTAWTFNRVLGSPVVDLGYEEVFSYSTDIGRPNAGFVAELTEADVSNLISNGATHVFIFSTFRDATTALGASEFTSAQNNLIASMELI